MAVLAGVMASAHVEAPHTAPAGGQELGFTGPAFSGGADAFGGAEVPAVEGVTLCSLLQAARRTAIPRKTTMTAERKVPLGTCMVFSLSLRAIIASVLRSRFTRTRTGDHPPGELLYKNCRGA
jgi:hypothetical protein